MLSLEEKQALLIERWNELRPVLQVKVKSKPAPPVPASPLPPSDQSKESNIDRLSRAIWEGSGRDLKSIVPAGVKNKSWYLLNLKPGKIEWVGNVAIGEDTQFLGWVNVVAPHGAMICYFGPGAMDRARAAAEKLSPYYL